MKDLWIFVSFQYICLFSRSSVLRYVLWYQSHVVFKNDRLRSLLTFSKCIWDRKSHTIELPYIDDFDEKTISTKARPTQMNHNLMEICKNEINTLLVNKIIRPSKSPWSCSAFYVNNAAEQERGAPRLVINYKPLNSVLKWIRYPIPNKRDLLKRTFKANLYSKFDLKSGFWQIQVAEHDKYKTAFNVPFGQYEWNVMPFGLKNDPSEFQNVMNSIFNHLSSFSIVYIDYVLIFSEDRFSFQAP